MLNDILSRVARVGAMHAGSQPAPPAERPQPCHGKPPTSPGKTIKHASFLGALLGAVAGALVAAAAFAVAAAAVAVTVAAIVAVTGFTGGLGLVLVVGAVKLAAGFGLTYLFKDQIAAISGGVAAMVDSVTPPFGPVVTGSGNVFVEKLPASRAEVDTVACTKHNSPQLIAQGSDTVYVNEHAAARIDDKTVCGGTLKEGASTVYFGAGQQTLLAIQDEFSWWEKAILIAVEFLVPPSKGLFKGLGKLFTHPRAVLRGMYAGALMTARELKRIAGCASRAFRESKGLARVKESIRAFLKDPVYIASGEVIESRQDIALGQTLPLVFERTYRTASSHTGLLGHGWHDSWSEVARVSQEGLNTHVVITLAQGFDIDFTFHQDIQAVFCPLYPEFTLYRRGAGFSLWHRDSQTWREFRAAHGDTRLLSEIRDTHDNHIALLRDGQGRLQQVRHSDGIEIRLVWQGEFVHQLIRTDGAQHTELALYRQDELGRLMEADATQLYHLYYEYDAANRLTRWHDHDQTWARYEYDEQGRCVFTTCADGFLTGRFEYYPNRVIMTDGQGHRSEYGFNALSLMSYQRSPLGHETRYEYDEHGNLLREISPQGRVTAFSYLEQTGLVSTFTDGSDQVWAYDYDEQERLCGVTDPLGRTWAWEYDSAGDPVQLTGPDASEVHFTWNRYGLLTQVSDRAGEVQARLQYDHRQRLLSATDAEGRMQHLRYDPQDRVVQWLRPDGAAYKFGYRRASWRLPEQLLRPDAREEQRQYDRHNNLLSYVDGNGAMWRQSYGAFDLLRSRTDAQGRTWRYDYDPETQQLTSVTAPDGNRWQWWLDADGRVIREQDMTGTVTHYGYDEDGHCIEVRNGEGERRSFQYDGRGLLIQETSPEETVHYRYDAVGRLTEVTSSVSHVQLEYDLRDRVVREWQNGTEVRRAYDEHSVTRTLQWSEEEKEEEGLTSTFLYSRTGELKQVVLPDGAELTINHDSAGRESERRGGRFLQTREYDAMGWLTREMTGQAHDGRIQAQQTREYRYDGAGNVTGVRTNRDREGYRLDKTGRVLSVLRGGAGRTPTAETDYHYTRTGLPQEQGRLTEWEAGRLVQRDDMYYTYDRAGRLVRRQEVKPGFRAQVWHYRWDSRNQLRAVDTPSGETWFYRYDPFGRRVSKRCAERGEEVRYLWDGDQIAEVRHYRQAQPTSRRHWVYNGWELVVQQRHIAAGGWETDFVSSAQNGEPQALYDSEGELRWQAPKATLWGQRAVAKTESADPGLAFAGQLRDSESGLCYNRFRYYDPTGGGYISPDPIGLAGGVNLYAYVPNPLSWIDPLGLAGCKLTKVNAPDHDYLLRLKRSEYPQTFGHISSAIKNGHPNIVTIQRVSAKSNRKLSLKGIKTKTGADRDEWPMAMFKEGGDGASVRYIDPSDNRGAGSSIGNILSNLPDGTRVKVEVY